MLSRLRTLLRERLARRLGVPAIGSAMERLGGQGFLPKLIFDVGAYRGEYAQMCRRVWPEAMIVCFEPQERARAELKPDSRMRVYGCLLGAEEKESVTLYEAETGSSILTEHVNAHPAVAHRMRTVDAVVGEDFGGTGPELLKLDVQGAELEVLRGAERTLKDVQVILAEVNLLDIHVGVPLMGELTAWLDGRGFVAFDICGLTRRPLDQALWQADLIFVRRDGVLRADKRWSA